MDEDNVTPISAAVSTKPKKCGPKEVAHALGQIQKKVHLIFCTLECASAGLWKAETDGGLDLWIRAARVVERCVEDLESLREDVDDAAGMAARSEAFHG
jgi:hypothetical protein